VVSTYFDHARAGLSTGVQPPYAGAMENDFKKAKRRFWSDFQPPKYFLLPVSIAPGFSRIFNHQNIFYYPFP